MISKTDNNITGNTSLCYFIHYSTTDILPYNVQLYINELSRHFDKVRVLCNNEKILVNNYSLKTNIEIIHNPNKGYDFGMFYRNVYDIDLNKYVQIAVINDSNILFNKLDLVFEWAKKDDADFWGIIDSHEKPWFSMHPENYHLQSHFLVFNKNAIQQLPSFLNRIDADKIFNEKDKKRLRRLVINEWEIGVSQFLIAQDLKPAAFVGSRDMEDQLNSKAKNLTYSMYHELASQGYPLLKKKVITGKKKWYKLKDKKWKNTIREYGNKKWSVEKIIDEFE
ncbi:hypothetical protein [uncultured Draconibacterium sp.]|uniref:hypothetical protein n=1 Tax=uncultured Draconibacterium sp. TaxID=1573823 RepID=UPI0029C9569F|nr:hypothetical protein [uncultured Draconibacterium sp.]